MKLIYFFIPILFLISCESNNTNEPSENDIVPKGSFYILNQGNWGGNNSSISIYDPNRDTLMNNFFMDVNSLELGDSANDMMVIGDKLYVLVSGSKLVSVIDMATCEQVSTISIPNSNFPWKWTNNGDKIFISDLYLNKVYVIDLATLTLEETEFQTGPGPENMAVINNNLIITNSALGELNDTVQGSRTASIIDLSTGEKIQDLEVGPNTRFVLADEANNSFYVGYSHFFSASNVGGLIEYDASTFEIKNEWSLDIQSNPLITDWGITYMSSVAISNLNKVTGENTNLIENETLEEFWSGFQYDSETGSLMILNAKDYVVQGEVLIYNSDLELQKSLQTGIIPYAISKY